MKVRNGRPVKNWPGLLRLLATARCLDRLRRRMSENSRRSSTPDWSRLASGNPGPDEQVGTRELAERVRRILAELPPREAQVACLRYLEELSYEEIGAQLKIRPNAVGVLLHKARQRMQALFGPV